jgi:hypothetical protein
MATNLNESLFWPIENALQKHFDTVYVDIFSGNDVIVKCMLSGHQEDIWYRFSIKEDVFYASNPYDVVNSIWEYIAKNVL